MRTIWATSTLSVFLALPALAQSTPQEQPDRPEREVRRERRAGRDAGQDGDRRRARAGGGALAMADRLKAELNLDEQQTRQFDAIVADYREKMQSQQEGGDDARDLMRQLREARDAGDDAKVQRLREQMRGRGGAGRDTAQGFLDEVEGILRDDQKEKLGGMRERLMRDMNRRGGPMDPMERLTGLRERLNLDEAQSQRWERLYNALQKEIAPVPGEADPAQAIREARESGEEPDPETMRELREAMAQRREKNQASIDQFLTKLDSVLNDEQRQSVAEFREEIARQGPGGGRGERDQNNPRIVFQAAQRLELTNEQRDQLNAIRQEVGKATEEAGRDAQKLAELRKQIEVEVREILTPEQAKQFDTALQRLQTRNRGEDRPGRPPGDGEERRPQRPREPGSERP